MFNDSLLEFKNEKEKLISKFGDIILLAVDFDLINKTKDTNSCMIIRDNYSHQFPKQICKFMNIKYASYEDIWEDIQEKIYIINKELESTKFFNQYKFYLTVDGIKLSINRDKKVKC